MHWSWHVYGDNLGAASIGIRGQTLSRELLRNSHCSIAAIKGKKTSAPLIKPVRTTTPNARETRRLNRGVPNTIAITAFVIVFIIVAMMMAMAATRSSSSPFKDRLDTLSVIELTSVIPVSTLAR